eukprot:TRINITY_DN3293_c0_g1_i1.p1 TRINITY_DN3293_c0_g1~~TRINITY_DN3293_c0_g1_i1.p1  ORF type:complete len:498 (-),score=129.11 TRINITY_DN3293_c0_g1_i1:46-1539(-)
MDSHGNVHVVENDEEFDILIETSGEQLVAVDFYATWCGPCKMISPLFAQMSLKYLDVIFLKVDVDKLRGTAQKYEIRAMPTFGFFKGNQLVDKSVGANPTALEQKIVMLSGPAGASNALPAPAAKPKQGISSQHFNQENYVYFDTGKTDVIVDKLLSFNPKFAGSPNALSDQEIKNLRSLVSTIEAANKYHATSFTKEEFAVMEKVIWWPATERFPALDLLRLQVMHPEAAKHYSTVGLFDRLIDGLNDQGLPFSVHMMILRFAANSFRWSDLRAAALRSFCAVLPLARTHLKHQNKSVRSAAATVLLNYAVAFTTEENVKSDKKPLAEALVQALKEETDEEAQFRLVMALGVLICRDPATLTDVQQHQAVLKEVKAVSKKAEDPLKELINILANPSGYKPPVVQSVPTPTVNTNMPTTTPFPAMTPPGMPNLPPGVDMSLMQRISSSPEMLRAMQNPQLMMKLQEVMADPSKMMLYQSDPEFVTLMQTMQRLMSGM